MMTPKTLCPTRWSVRSAAISSLLATYPAVLQMMDHLSSSGTDVSSVAAGLFAQLGKSEVYLSLLIARDVFGPTEKLSLVLEGHTQTVSGACEAVEVTLKHLRSLRTLDHFGKLWEEMTAVQEDLELRPPILPRIKKVPMRLEHTTTPAESTVFNTAQGRLRAIFYEIIDTVVNEIERRFVQPGTEKVKVLETVLFRQVGEWRKIERDRAQVFGL